MNLRLPRQRGLFWPSVRSLAYAGGVFVLCYSGCNYLTSLRSDTGTIFFEWERNIPFIKEMVIPYWSLDLFFIGSFFLCRNRSELNVLTARLVTVVLLSCICFLLFPLKFGWARPEPSGWTAPLFRALYANDMPYNLAPSLHISLRSLVWIVYGASLRGKLRTAVKWWFIFIGLSTLFVWQHHFMDVVTGFMMGWLVQVLIPAKPATRAEATPAHRKLTLRYGAGAAVCTVAALPGGAWLFFGWPAVALGIVTLAYARRDTRFLGKENGTFSPSAEWCLLPVILGTRFIQRRWLRRTPATVQIAEKVRFGRLLTGGEAAALLAEGPCAVLDLTAESNAPALLRERAHYRNVPMLDLTASSPAAVKEAVAFIAEHQPHRTVYIHCQLGLMRSAAVMAAWLKECGAATTAEEAQRMVKEAQPLVVWHEPASPAAA